MGAQEIGDAGANGATADHGHISFHDERLHENE
jgi:hypothetical protein